MNPSIRLRRRRRSAGFFRSAALVAAGAAAAAVCAYLDKRRRHILLDRAASTLRHGVDRTDRARQYATGVVEGAAHRATAPLREERQYDDVTLARKVETELFRAADAPKGSVSVNAQHGIVELRGEVKRPEQVRELGEQAARVEGVRDVHNLLHTPGSPPKHSPPSDPGEVRERAEQPEPSSRFSRNPATTPPADEPMVHRAAEHRREG